MNLCIISLVRYDFGSEGFIYVVLSNAKKTMSNKGMCIAIFIALCKQMLCSVAVHCGLNPLSQTRQP